MQASLVMYSSHFIFDQLLNWLVSFLLIPGEHVTQPFLKPLLAKQVHVRARDLQYLECGGNCQERTG